METLKKKSQINKKSDTPPESGKVSKKNRKSAERPRPVVETEDIAGGPPEFALPSRLELYDNKRGAAPKKREASAERESEKVHTPLAALFARIRASQQDALLGYIPPTLFLALCLCTLGLYPYVWLWSNASGFVKIGGARIRENALRRFAAMGFCVQLLAAAAVFMYLWSRIAGSEAAHRYAYFVLLAYLLLYLFLVLPLRCFHFFELRWNIRNAVIEWDSYAIMIGRTMTSWTKLFLGGSAYIQWHINRLIGLGMPGFADADELADLTITELIDRYIRRPAPPERGAPKEPEQAERGAEDEDV